MPYMDPTGHESCLLFPVFHNPEKHIQPSLIEISRVQTMWKTQVVYWKLSLFGQLFRGPYTQNARFSTLKRYSHRWHIYSAGLRVTKQLSTLVMQWRTENDHRILCRFRVFWLTDLNAPMSCIYRPYFFKFAWVYRIGEYVHVPPPRNEWKRVVSILALRVSLHHLSQRPCLRKYNHPSCLILCIYICTVETVKNIFISLHVYLHAYLCICMLKNVFLLCLVELTMQCILIGIYVSILLLLTMSLT